MGQLVAAADIGSNTAHLLIAHLTQTGLKRVVNTSEWLDLGEVVSREGEIPKAEAKRLFGVMRDYRDIIVGYKVRDSYFFATEAMRKAANHEEVLGDIQAKLGIRVEIVTPRREAELSYLASQLDCSGPDPTLMVEAGGGSVQVAFCQAGEIVQELSLPIGTGVLRAKAALASPATDEQAAALRGLVEEACDALSEVPPTTRIVACGGVARGLWRALHPDGAKRLVAKELEFLAWDCQRLRPDEISARYDVKLERARTLLPGSIVYLQVMAAFAHDSMTVSLYGVREGAVLEVARATTEE